MCVWEFCVLVRQSGAPVYCDWWQYTSTSISVLVYHSYFLLKCQSGAPVYCDWWQYTSTSISVLVYHSYSLLKCQSGAPVYCDWWLTNTRHSPSHLPHNDWDGDDDVLARHWFNRQKPLIMCQFTRFHCIYETGLRWMSRRKLWSYSEEYVFLWRNCRRKKIV